MVPNIFSKFSRIPHRNISFVRRVKLIQQMKENDTFCQERMETAEFLFYHKGKPLLSLSPPPAITWINYTEAKCLSPHLRTSSTLLGVSDSGTAQFATLLPSEDSSGVELLEDRYNSTFTDLRTGLFMVSSDLAQVLTKGWSLLMWSRKNRFCSSCKGELVKPVAGHQGKCGECGGVNYPNPAPVGIVCVSDADQDNLLLVRQPRFPPGMFSCIAGFLDVGETLEECVRREVAEEVGLEVGGLRYSSSQHWPFPASSLMIGCHATALPDQVLEVDEGEIEEARWFSRQEVENALQRKGKGGSHRFFIPPKGALARVLIEDWLAST